MLYQVINWKCSENLNESQGPHFIFLHEYKDTLTFKNMFSKHGRPQPTQNKGKHSSHEIMLSNPRNTTFTSLSFVIFLYCGSLSR